MRSRNRFSMSGGEVHQWVLDWLLQAKLVKDHGWRCTAVTVLNVVVRAAARSMSVSAVCRDLSEAPSGQGVITALDKGLPQTLKVLERRVNDALTGSLPRRMRRRKWQVAIDWHLSPYYGEPYKSRNELCTGKPRQGTKRFHAYASACIVERGQRYTLALTYVRRHESKTVVLRRLVEQIRRIELKIKCVLLDRDFFNVQVIEYLQSEQLPFLMPVMIRGKVPRRGRKVTGLHWIKRQSAGWYRHTLRNQKRNTEVTVSICVGYRRHKNRKDGKQVNKKLLFAAWRTKGTPTQIRNRYRKRFAIETSYRQIRQARIYTCTRNPRLRLFFVAVSLILRNLWVWIHANRLGDRSPAGYTVRLERLRFPTMLERIAQYTLALFSNGTTTYILHSP
jgi:hypothetical protein